MIKIINKVTVTSGRTNGMTNLTVKLKFHLMHSYPLTKFINYNFWSNYLKNKRKNIIEVNSEYMNKFVYLYEEWFVIYVPFTMIVFGFIRKKKKTSYENSALGI